MTVRPGLPEDAAAISRVFQACWRKAYPGVVAPAVIERVTAGALPLWRGLLEPGGDWSVAVWDEAGQVVGVVRFGHDPDQSSLGHVFSLYVDPDCGRRGIGAALLGRAEEWFAANGLPGATLWVFEANASARRFYSGRGWRPDGRSRTEPEFEAREVGLLWQPLAVQLAGLDTERSRPELAELDSLAVPDLVELMNREDGGVAAAVGAASAQIGDAIEAVTGRLAGGGRLLYIGAGTAGRLGVLDAAECVPTFNTAEGQVLGLIAGGEEAIRNAVEGAEDNAEAGRRDLEAAGLTSEDAVVGISASGRTPYVLGAIAYANLVGAATIGLACNRDSPLGRAARHPIEIAVGPEVIAGSTRLKAGTAQKLVLNMISTIAMIRLGKTYGNLMIDVRAGNEKLRERAVRIVGEAAGTDLATARGALAAAGGEVKTAVVMLRAKLDAEAARGRLEQAGGNLRSALSGFP